MARNVSAPPIGGVSDVVASHKSKIFYALMGLAFITMLFLRLVAPPVAMTFG